MQKSRILALSALFALAASVWPVEAQRNNNQQPKRTPQEQQDIDALVRLVDASIQAEPLVTAGAFGAKEASQGEVSVKWDFNHFVKGQDGNAYIPYTLTVDRAGLPNRNVAMYVRVLDQAQAEAIVTANDPKADEKTRKAAQGRQYSWDNIQFLELPDDGKLTRAIQLKPGKYVAYFAVKERTPANQRNQRNAQAAPAKAGLLRRELVVPAYTDTELATSTVILARSVEPQPGQLSPQEQEANPYVFGPMKIVPQMDARYAKSGELNVIFWIYGARDASGGKPDVTVEYNFHQRLAEGEKYFNKTAPQQLNAQSLPPEFNVAAGHQLPGSLVVPLASFPSGDYRLEIKVTDKPSGRSVTQNVNFTVLAS